MGSCISTPSKTLWTKKRTKQKNGSTPHLQSFGEDIGTVENDDSKGEILEKFTQSDQKYSPPQQPDSEKQEYDAAKKSNCSLNTALEESPRRLVKPSVISNIILIKGQEKRLAFTFVGRQDLRGRPVGIFVKKVFPSENADENGRLKEGDEILKVNGVSLQGLTAEQAFEILKQLKNRIGVITVCTTLCSSNLSPFPTHISQSRSPSSNAGGETPISDLNKGDVSSLSQKVAGPKDRIIIEVILNKEPGMGLGIVPCQLTLENSSPGIYIQRLVSGSVAKKDSRLSRGDQILEADSVSFHQATLSKAYAILNKCNPGPVNLIISRHPDPKVSEQEMDEAFNLCTHQESKETSPSHILGKPLRSPSLAVGEKQEEAAASNS